MITAPTNWETLESQVGSFLQSKVEIAPSSMVSYAPLSFYDDSISNEGVTIEHALCDDMSVGNVSSAMIKLTLVNVSDVVINAISNGNAPLNFYVRMSSADGLTVTDWVLMGSFRIYEIVNMHNGTVTITGYDEIKRLEGIAYADEAGDASISAICTFGASKSSVFTNTAIASDSAFSVDVPEAEARAKPLRDVLKAAATVACRNIYVTKGGVLAAKSLYGVAGLYTITQSTGVLYSATSVDYDFNMPYVNGVYISNGNINCRKFGNLLVVDVPNGYTIDNAFIDTLNIHLYQTSNKPQSMKYAHVVANGVIVSPLVELGDAMRVQISDTQYLYFPLSKYRLTFTRYCYGELSHTRTDSTIQAVSYSSPPESIRVRNAKPRTETSYSATFEYIGDGWYAIKGNSNYYLTMNNGTDTPSNSSFSVGHPRVFYVELTVIDRYDATQVITDNAYYVGEYVAIGRTNSYYYVDLREVTLLWHNDAYYKSLTSVKILAVPSATNLEFPCA